MKLDDADIVLYLPIIIIRDRHNLRHFFQDATDKPEAYSLKPRRQQDIQQDRSPYRWTSELACINAHSFIVTCTLLISIDWLLIRPVPVFY